METLRTPDDRFRVVPDFGYPAQYADVPDADGGTLRMAWVEAGPPDGPVALLLHGEPTWSYLYRTVMAELAARGHPLGGRRPGRLRPLRQADADRGPHVRAARRVGAGAGLRPPRPARRDAGRPGLGRADRAAAGRGARGPLRPGRGREHRPADGRLRHAARSGGSSAGRSRTRPMLDVGTAGRRRLRGRLCRTRRVRRTTRRSPTRATRRARGRCRRSCRPRRTTRPPRPTARPGSGSSRWEKPFLVAFSDGDPITGAMAPILKKLVPGARGPRAPGGHRCRSLPAGGRR